MSQLVPLRMEPTARSEDDQGILQIRREWMEMRKRDRRKAGARIRTSSAKLSGLNNGV